MKHVFCKKIYFMLKIVWDKFRLKSIWFCNSFNAIYIAFCLGCQEKHIAKIRVAKTKLRKSDYAQNICDNMSIKNIYVVLKKALGKYFPLLAKVCATNKSLRVDYETNGKQIPKPCLISFKKIKVLSSLIFEAESQRKPLRVFSFKS